MKEYQWSECEFWFFFFFNFDIFWYFFDVIHFFFTTHIFGFEIACWFWCLWSDCKPWRNISGRNVSSPVSVLMFVFVRLKEHVSIHHHCSFLETIDEIPFSHIILYRFWSTRFQIIDNPVYFLHIMKTKFVIFHENS